ncbi:MAG: protein translocase subunit SecF [Burkholderiaceae bacterium]|jgi:preprotein translocase subunit SecF
MEFFRIRRDIPFMRHALTFNVISLLSFVAAVVFLVLRGLNFSVEFTGGVVLEAQYAQAPDLESLRRALSTAGVTEPQVQNFGTSREVIVRLAAKDAGLPAIATAGKLDTAKFQQSILAAGGPSPKVMRVEYVGPQVGKELAQHGALALGMVVIGIMIYLAIRFEWKFAVAAIIANLHDVIIILGFFAFFQWEFSLSVLAAVLAVLGYSVNESVVVFDRIRETFRKVRKMSVPDVINHAITSTISRTVITHGSTQLMVTSMLFFGGPTLHYFALALTIGILFGIYSSVLVASPIVMWLGVSREDLIKAPKKDGLVEAP